MSKEGKVMLEWAVRDLLSALPEKRDWLNPDAERVLKDFVKYGLPATANKATEEGELNFKRYEIDCDGLPFEDARGTWVAYADFEADRASRQGSSVPDCFANKAEVDLSQVTDEQVAEVCFGVYPPDFKDDDGDIDYLRYDGAVVRKFMVTRNTSPATTGASTVPTDDEIMSKYKQIVAYPERLTSGDYAAAIKMVRHFGKVAPASTVLTDERVYEIAEATLIPQWRLWRHTTIPFARAIEREVAAQAGQVAAPEDGLRLALKTIRPMAYSAPQTAQWIAEAVHIADEALAADPSAPGLAQLAPAPIEGQVAWSIDLQARLITASQDIAADEDARQVMAEAACLLASLTGAQASTAGERPEQQS